MANTALVLSTGADRCVAVCSADLWSLEGWLSYKGIGLRDSQFSTVSASRPVTMVSRKNRPVMCPLGEG